MACARPLGAENSAMEAEARQKTGPEPYTCPDMHTTERNGDRGPKRTWVEAGA